MTSPTRVVLPPKRQAEGLVAVFDFTAKVQSGDSLSNIIATCTVWSGVDPTPSAVLTGVNSFLSTYVAGIGIQAGVTGVIYNIAVKVTASLSGTLELDGFLAIIPQAA